LLLKLFPCGKKIDSFIPSYSSRNMVMQQMEVDENDQTGIQQPVAHHHPVEPQWENTIPEDLLDHPLLLAMQESHSPFLVTNPRLPGNPIIYINNRFLDIIGYSQNRVLGRNCRFMQGPETDPVVVGEMRDAVDEGRNVTVTLLNYRADCSTFYNHIVISAVKDPETKEVLYFFGVTEEVAARPTERNDILVPVEDQVNASSE
jgi:PAS domain S-box-containing protein